MSETFEWPHIHFAKSIGPVCFDGLRSAGGGAGDAAKAVTYRCSTTDSMRKLSAELLVYCQLLPFDSSGSSAMAVHPTSMLAKL